MRPVRPGKRLSPRARFWTEEGLEALGVVAFVIVCGVSAAIAFTH